MTAGKNGEASGYSFAGISTRVGAIEKGFDDLKVDFHGLRQDITNQIRDLAAAVRGRGTNWGAIGTIGGVVVGALLTMGTQALQPLYKDVDRHDSSIERIKATGYTKQDAASDLDTVRRRMDRDETENAHRIDQMVSLAQFVEFKESVLRDMGYLKVQTDTIDNNLIKRPEIEAQHRTEDQRYDALSARSNAIQAQLDSLFPASKTIDEMWAQLRENRNQFSQTPQLPIAPIAPIAPLAPVVPVHPSAQ